MLFRPLHKPANFALVRERLVIEAAGIEFIDGMESVGGVRLRRTEMDRLRKSKAEIEAFCLEALRARLGMRSLTAVRIVRYNGQQNWTWEVSQLFGDVGPVAFTDVIEEVRKLQHTYDLE